MSTQEKFIEEINKLNEEQKQVLKDTIKFGWWGDCDYEFQNENGEYETTRAEGYITNNEKNGGHFQGRKISGLFRGIYKQMIHAGGIINHRSNWWGNGSSDILFVKEEYRKLFEDWAKEVD